MNADDVNVEGPHGPAEPDGGSPGAPGGRWAEDRPADGRPGGWAVVLPVKPLARAKSRLAAATGPLRPALALAFALDTVTAALRCPEVARVVVVTDDPLAAAELARAGAEIVPDEPGAGLNAALAHGARHAASHPDAERAAERTAEDARARTRAHAPGHAPGVVAMSADLPALRPHELALVLRAAAGHPRAFLADAHEVGTTLLTARAGVALGPAFGGESRARHAASGARELAGPGLEVPSVRRDVDTEEDLRAAVRLGLGPHTAEVVRRLRPTPDPAACAQVTGP